MRSHLNILEWIFSVDCIAQDVTFFSIKESGILFMSTFKNKYSKMKKMQSKSNQIIYRFHDPMKISIKTR